MVEQLLAEATADRLIRPSFPHQPIEVKAASPLRNGPNRSRQFSSRFNSNRNSNNNFQRSPGRDIPRTSQRATSPSCYNCGGKGHYSRYCSSPRYSRQNTGTPSQRSYSRERSFSSPPRSSYSRPYSDSRRRVDFELSQAREQIKALTLSLRDNESALQQSDARINALVKRNEELANSTFGHPSSFASPSSPHVKFILPICMLLCCTVVGAVPTSAWLCPRDSADTIARIPLSYNCSHILPKVDGTPLPLPLHVYRPNTVRYDTPAFLCKIITRTVTFSVNFFGYRFENHTETYSVVSLETCQLMTQHHRCEYGDMSQADNIWSSSNTLAIDWPSAPFGCCVQKTVTVSNCLLIPTTVHMRHGSEVPDSPVGNLAKCSYEAGHCLLKDGSMLWWTPNKRELCRFIPVMKMKGRQLGEVWISDSKEFALSWRDSSTRIQDCGAPLILTDQGYAITPVTRVPRSAAPDTGLITSNQLAAQLLAVEGSVHSAVSALFHHALSAICDRTNLLAFALHTSLSTNPTLTVRNLLGRNDIAATSVGNDLVQIHRCMPVPSQSVRLIPFNSSCFSKPLVELSLPRGALITSFIDPSTLVLSHDATPIDCSNISPFYFNNAQAYYRFDSISGDIQAVPPSQVRQIAVPSTFNESVVALPLTIFHNLVLTNLSELVQDHQWTELWSSVSPDYLLKASSVATSISSSTATHSSLSSTFSLFPSLWGSWSAFDIWVSLCSLCVSFGLLRTAIILYCNIYYPGALPAFREQFM
ncbi:unnamed protein product, partial [Haemonchus placei]|uniref:CCHC-type domain-containing protein n=1 Tax=Haemonchus placei TaxID=6290 RepID=A0A0N4VUS6_HAEPC